MNKMKDKLLATHAMASMVTTIIMLSLRLIPHANLLGVLGYMMVTMISPVLLPVLWFGSILDIVQMSLADQAVQSWIACGTVYLACFLVIFRRISGKKRSQG